ncbi:MAG: formin [Deltaproteobacteria bacterium]|nr:formin [Deltaproteobacteria bacterium]
MGEEVIAERKKAAKKWILYIVIASVVTGVLGFALGGLKKAGDIGRESVKGAGELAKEVEKSNQVMVELSDAIGQGIEQLKPGNDKYPNELATKIKSINIPFEVSLLRGRVIGGLPGNVLQAVLAYAGGVKDTNETKDKLGGLLGQAKESVEKVFQQKKEPAVNFSVVFSEGGGGLVAELVRHKQPFAQKGKWPGSYTVVRSVGGKSKDVEADRYGGKGNLTGGDKAVAIPVEESTIAPYTAEAAIFQLRKVLADAKELLDGRQSPIPSLETEGLIKQGDRLMEELKKVMQAGGGG